MFVVGVQVSRVCSGPEEEEQVEGRSVAVYQYSLVPTRASVHMELAGRVSYQWHDGEPQSMPFSYALSFPDFIRCRIQATCPWAHNGE